MKNKKLILTGCLVTLVVLMAIIILLPMFKLKEVDYNDDLKLGNIYNCANINTTYSYTQTGSNTVTASCSSMPSGCNGSG